MLGPQPGQLLEKSQYVFGMVKQTGTSFPARQRLVAYHEAGHAVMGALTPDYDMVTKVTILPRTNGAGGFTLFTPSEERLESGLYSKRHPSAHRYGERWG